MANNAVQAKFTERLELRLRRDQWNVLQHLAAVYGIPISALVRQAIDDAFVHVEQHGGIDDPPSPQLVERINAGFSRGKDNDNEEK